MSSGKISSGLGRFLRARSVRHKADLPWGKVLYFDPERDAYIKASSSSKGMALIRAEATGLELLGPLLGNAVQLPTGEVLRDEPDGIALSLSRVVGTPISKWARPAVSLSPLLAHSSRVMSLSDLLTLDPVPPLLRQKLIAQFGNPDVTVSTSHGDYIYWNVLVGAGRAALVDFEYVRPNRILGFDDLHYQLAPWMIRWMRWGLPFPAFRRVGLVKARSICRELDLPCSPELLLALFFVHWAGIQRQWHPDFQPRRVELVERWAARIMPSRP